MCSDSCADSGSWLVLHCSSLTQCAKHRCLCGLLTLGVVVLHAMLAYAEVTFVVGERVTAVVRDFVLQEGSLGWCGHRPLMRECCVSHTLSTTSCNLFRGLFLDRIGIRPSFYGQCDRRKKARLAWHARMRHTLMASCYGIGRLCALSISVTFGFPWHDAPPDLRQHHFGLKVVALR